MVHILEATDSLMKNVIIHVGFHKTGTTFLQHYFKQHPDVWYDQSFFEQYRQTGEITIENQIKDCQVTESNVALSEEQLTVWNGVLNPLGAKFQEYNIEAHQKRNAQKLFELYPNAKILITIRGFDTLLQSLYAQYVLNGGVLFFGDFFEVQQKNKLQKLFNYDYVFSIYSKMFGAKNVLILPYELLKENPAAYIATIEKEFDFPSFTFSTEAINRALPKLYLYLLVCISNVVLFLIKPFSKPKQLKIYGRYISSLFMLKEGVLDRLTGKSIKLSKEQLRDAYKLFEHTTDKVLNEKYVKRFVNHYKKRKEN